MWYWEILQKKWVFESYLNTQATISSISFLLIIKFLKFLPPKLSSPHAKSWLIGKDPDAGRDWGQEEKGTAEDEMAGWHHRLDEHEFE